MPPLRYETARLVLKALTPVDAPTVLDYYRRNRSFLEPWEPLRGDDFYTPEFHAEQLARDFSQTEAGEALRLYLFKRGDEGRVIGSLGFSNIVRGPFLSCFLGYKLDGAETNRGYMTEALRTGLKVIFQDYGLHRVEANIIPRNVSSLRVVEKLGFRSEGLSRQYLKIHGIWEDHVHMVLLNEEL
ncbi:Ribosomal-protein-alanine acetyltransferase [uncultured Eubacteriales bacterium]|uniref:Ribosomal-protein-alanine acetyltransferase n=1 Tax=uncultured Eubacteriales bacterium TaxID=172733 RepID=A0A212IUF3_9FIRM|nr:Ribosomal-protein-alanine acetyltransferase [uncultured Eubacteriales bacterium]